MDYHEALEILVNNTRCIEGFEDHRQDEAVQVLSELIWWAEK